MFKLGDMPAALEYLQRAYRIKPDAEIAAHLGEVLWLMDRRDEAQQTWSDAARRHPRNDVLNAVRRSISPDRCRAFFVLALPRLPAGRVCVPCRA